MTCRHTAPSESGSLRALPLTELDRTTGFLADQQVLFRDHEYGLQQSRELFPHQALNSGRLGELHGGLVAGRLDWPGAVDLAGGWARGESSRRVDGADRALSGGRRLESQRQRDHTRQRPADGRG
ncbi:MAG: hypothetical protein GEV07_20295 [Streptosporangiales bacterium]|nr:hypothetical protein [Streptosporangiales bacterium]